ncbi:MAG: tRNA threonylcarbamoyladenosine dehydratase [Opitutales bacterium]|nr:tRNA threonylcarbamoyladenosine dehydratase [Opitutales bacterium]
MQNPSFDGIARLLGTRELEILRRSRIMVIGLGGVGSWVVEGLARSGLGAIDLVDLDDICQSNINRQLPALTGTIGLPKAEVLAERCRSINPDLRAEPRLTYYSATNSSHLLSLPPDLVVDAIDSMAHKTHLLATCRNAGIPVITTGGGGGKTLPELIIVCDLAETRNDPLLARTRKVLRQKHHFPRKIGQRFRIPTIYSPELPRYPAADGSTSLCKPPADPTRGTRLDCAGGLGAASFVTGTMGFIASSVAIRRLLAHKLP